MAVAESADRAVEYSMIKITSHVEIVTRTPDSVTVKSSTGALQTFYFVAGRLSLRK